MKREVDARGKPCPQPVVITKKALTEIPAGTVITLVDNPVARDNVIKLAESLGCGVQVEERGEGFAVCITKEKPAAGPGPGTFPEPENTMGGTVILIPTPVFGRAEGELGQILLKMFLYTLAESDKLPAALVLLNEGVRLAVGDAETVPPLGVLATAGVDILVCGTCLEYLGLQDSLAVGEISNMYTITERLLEARKVITVS